MAQKTFLQLKSALASLWGYEDVTDLPAQDIEDIETYINAALFECYAPINGTKPNYGEQHWSDLIPAAVPVTLGVTFGSKVITGYVFSAKYAASVIKIGERVYHYSGLNGPDEQMVEPWDGATGPVAAIVYHNAIALPGMLSQVIDFPELLGLGLLKPIPSQENEQLFRTDPSRDFTPSGGLSIFSSFRRRYNANAFDDTGDPAYYHIDSSSVAPTFAVGNRIHVYPYPDQKYTISLRASFVSADPLTDDGAIPPMPFQAIDNILLPIAKELLVMNTAGRRFTGNPSMIIELAKRARNHLQSLTRPQRSAVGSFRPAKGW